MYFIGNTCFRRKIVYYNKMYVHFPILRKRLTPSLTKPRTYVFKNVSATALHYAYVFLILTRVFSSQKSRLAFYDITYVIIYEIIYFTLALFLYSLWMEWTRRNCFPSWMQKYLHASLQATFFFFDSASVLLNFSSV